VKLSDGQKDKILTSLTRLKAFAQEKVEERMKELKEDWQEADSDHTILTGRMCEVTRHLDSHPEWWDLPCECKSCQSYGEPEETEEPTE